jgi:hypothetical protein
LPNGKKKGSLSKVYQDMMTEDKIKDVLDMLHKYFKHSDITMSTYDLWGGSTAWGYEITYNPETQIYLWEDTEDVGAGFRAVESFQLSEAEVIEKLQKI